MRSIASKQRRDAAHSGSRAMPFVPLTRRLEVTASVRGRLDIRGHCLAFRGHVFPAAIVVGRQRTRKGEAWSRAHHRRNSTITKAHAPTLSGSILGLSTLSRSPLPTLTSWWPIFVFVEATGIEPTLVVWDKRKEWPLPRRCRCVLEGPLLAGSRGSRCSPIAVGRLYWTDRRRAPLWRRLHRRGPAMSRPPRRAEQRPLRGCSQWTSGPKVLTIERRTLGFRNLAEREDLARRFQQLRDLFRRPFVVLSATHAQVMNWGRS